MIYVIVYANNTNYFNEMLKYPLNKRISIYQGVSDITSMLSEKLRYVEYCNIFAGVYVRSGVSTINIGEQYLYTTEFTIRWTLDTKIIDNTFRILYDEKWYNIIEVIETEPRHILKIIANHYGNN